MTTEQFIPQFFDDDGPEVRAALIEAQTILASHPGDGSGTTTCDECVREFPDFDYDGGTPLVSPDLSPGVNLGLVCLTCRDRAFARVREVVAIVPVGVPMRVLLDEDGEVESVLDVDLDGVRIEWEWAGDDRPDVLDVTAGEWRRMSDVEVDPAAAAVRVRGVK